MAYTKTYQIDGKSVPFKASAVIGAKYRILYGHSIAHDISVLEHVIESNDRNTSTVAPSLLRRFLNIAHIMARHADPTLPSDPDAWLAGFHAFNIYKILPHLSFVWQSYVLGDPIAADSVEDITPENGSTAQGDIEHTISEWIAAHCPATLIDSIMVNRDQGSKKRGKYIVRIYLIWNARRVKESAKQTLLGYSNKIAAMISENELDIRELYVFWSTPGRDKTVMKCTYKRTGTVLEGVGLVWVGVPRGKKRKKE